MRVTGRTIVVVLASAIAVVAFGLVSLAPRPIEAVGEPLQVLMSVSKEGNTVTYSITLVNTSSEDVGDVYLAGSIPEGATPKRASATPGGAWFRGFEGAGTSQAAVWLSAKVAKDSRQGPFSFQVDAEGTPAAHAWVHWKSPSEGTALSAAADRAFSPLSGYAGSESCAKCHAAKYNDFRTSGHPYKLQPAAEAKFRPLPLPEGYTWDDITYVIGGANWKSRYVDKQGYIISSAGGKPGKNQYNIESGKWSDYNPGQTLKYDCGSCHTTGYSTQGKQDGLPGMVGTWVFPGIQCEACHGPGAEHARAGDKAAIKIDKSAAACGACHIRGDAQAIPAKGGFIQHHEQYNEQLAGPHQALSCVTCHDPHKPAEFSIKTDCTSCHSAAKTAFTGSSMQKVGVKCTDCHMPEATKSAVNTSANKADVKTHIFKINTDATAKMFTDDGNFAKGFVTLNFACLQCHADKNVEWAASLASRAHTIGK